MKKTIKCKSYGSWNPLYSVLRRPSQMSESFMCSVRNLSPLWLNVLRMTRKQHLFQNTHLCLYKFLSTMSYYLFWFIKHTIVYFIFKITLSIIQSFTHEMMVDKCNWSTNKRIKINLIIQSYQTSTCSFSCLGISTNYIIIHWEFKRY